MWSAGDSRCSGGAGRPCCSMAVPAVSSHGVGDLVLGADGVLSRAAAVRAPVIPVDTGLQGRCGYSARRGWGAACAGRADCGRSARFSGAVTRIDLAHRRIGWSRSGYAIPSGFASRPGTSELWIGDVDTAPTSWTSRAERRSAAQLRLALLRGPQPARSRRGRRPVAERLYAAGTVRGPRPSSTETSRFSTTAIPAAPGPRRSPGSPSIRAAPTRPASAARSFSPTTRVGASGRCCPERTAGPIARLELFRTGVASPVELVVGPAGDLFYLDFTGGAVHRLRYVGAATS